MPRQVRRKSKSGIFHIMFHKDREPSPVLHDITKIKGLPASGQTEINSAAASGNPPVDIVSKKYTSVNTSISENTENDSEKNSIAVLSADEFLDK